MVKLKTLLKEIVIPEVLRKSLALCPSCNEALYKKKDGQDWVCKKCGYEGPNQPLKEINDTLEWRYWWMDPDLKFHPVEHEGHAGFAAHYLMDNPPDPSRVNPKHLKFHDKYYIMYALGWVRLGLAPHLGKYILAYNYDPDKPLTDRQKRAINNFAKEIEADEIRDNTKGIWIRIDEAMFPKEFDRHKRGSCMAAAELATKYLLSKGIKDFKIVEGWVAFSDDWELYRGKGRKMYEAGDVFSHTWIEFPNGRRFDPTKKQWKEWGYDPDKAKIVKVKTKYSPEEYMDTCEWEPSPWVNFKKTTLKELEFPMAKPEDSWSGAHGDVNWKGKLVWMTPENFLRLAYPLPERMISQNTLQRIEQRYKDQLPVDFLILYVDMAKKKVTGHEGRHRATVAKKMGIEKVPVLIYTGSGFERVPKWDKATHDLVDKADFKPEK